MSNESGGFFGSDSADVGSIEHLDSCNLMEAGDYIEFLSDKQTEKGPSAGKINISMGDQLLIEHSDCTEEFKASELRVHKKTNHHKGGTLWQLD